MQSANPTRPQAEHAVSLTDRKRASIAGVEDVDCFNEQIVVLRTPLGTLTVTGSGLNISHLNLDEGRVEIEGELGALEYTGGKKSGGAGRGGLLGRLFR